MEKDDIEKRKLYISQFTLNKDNSDNDIKVASSIYRIKNKESFDINNNINCENNPSVKKVYNSDDNNTNINNEKKTEIAKYIQSKSQHNSRENSTENKSNKNKTEKNKRYHYFDNDDISEKYDDFSLGNELQEKPNIINYKQINANEKQENLKENLEQMMPSDEVKNKLRKSSINNIKMSYLQEEDPKSNEGIKGNQIKKKDDSCEKYLSSQKFADKAKIFIVLFSIGIALSAVSLIFCIFLQLYGNQDVYIILSTLSLILIILYILAIKFFLDDKKTIISIIKKEKIQKKYFILKQENVYY